MSSGGCRGCLNVRARCGHIFGVLVSRVSDFKMVAERAIEQGLIVQSLTWDGVTKPVEPSAFATCKAPIFSGSYYEQPSYCDNDVPCADHPGWFALKLGVGHGE